MPSVSVIVPAFNASQTIARCLDSLVTQRGTSVDVIVVDDGSTDRTPAILDYYAAAHQELRVIHTNNGGPSRARNIGLGLVTSDYVGFCDSDDWVDSDCLSNALEAGLKHGADIVTFGYKNVRERSTRAHAWRGERKMGALEFAQRCLLDPRVRGFAWNKLYSRELVTRVRFPEGVNVCEDLLFNVGLARRNERLAVCSVSGCPYNYDLNGKSLTRNFSVYGAVRKVLMGIAEDPNLARAAHAALYSSCVKAAFDTLRGGVLHA